MHTAALGYGHPRASLAVVRRRSSRRTRRRREERGRGLAVNGKRVTGVTLRDKLKENSPSEEITPPNRDDGCVERTSNSQPNNILRSPAMQPN